MCHIRSKHISVIVKKDNISKCYLKIKTPAAAAVYITNDRLQLVVPNIQILQLLRRL
jgi:hypothetical protein